MNDRTVDASEYEPQVVELPTEAEAEESKGSESGASSSEEVNITGFAPKEKESTGGSQEKGPRYLYEGLSKEERLEIWRKKLHEMQQKYLASLSEQEREDLLRRLNL